MTVNDRSTFADLQDGSMIPGYKGYIPKYKFHQGYTYGLGTHEMYKLRKDEEAATGGGGTARTALGSSGFTMKRSNTTLPPADGVNKLTEDMKPGYTGYVPRRPFIFGATYRQECEECVDEFLSTKESNQCAKDRLETVVASYPKLNPITKESLVVKKLNHLKDHKEGAPAIAEDKRTGSEPPIPGYTGFVPRIDVTELGLGGRYNVTSEKGFRDFFNQSLNHASTLGQQISPNSFRPAEVDTASLKMAAGQDEDCRRLYHKTGMLPKYTGYLPHEPYAFGKTYGNMTRSLSVCTHDFPTYGIYREDGRRTAKAQASARQ
jgi:hypothetical protein